MKNKNEIIIIILKTHSSLPIKTYCVYEKNKKIKKKRQRRIVCARVIFVCLRNLVYHRIHTEIIWCERAKNKMAAKSWKQHIKFRRNIVFFVGFRLVKNMYFFFFWSETPSKKEILPRITRARGDQRAKKWMHIDSCDESNLKMRKKQQFCFDSMKIFVSWIETAYLLKQTNGNNQCTERKKWRKSIINFNRFCTKKKTAD